jgi:hypothetical protein
MVTFFKPKQIRHDSLKRCARFCLMALCCLLHFSNSAQGSLFSKSNSQNKPKLSNVPQPTSGLFTNQTRLCNTCEMLSSQSYFHTLHLLERTSHPLGYRTQMFLAHLQIFPNSESSYTVTSYSHAEVSRL